MIRFLRRGARVYGAVVALAPKLYLAYRLWVWTEFVVQLLSMTIFVFFWRAVYANSASRIGGLNLAQTINYILLAQTLAPLIENRLIFQFGWMIRSGQVAMDLLRPMDFQGRFYVEALTNLFLFLLLKLPLLLIAVLVFGLQLPADLLTWVVFLVSLILGHAILFFVDWLFACLAFYSTETWGLSVVRVAVGTFFSGALIPLAMMPGWLQSIANALPFAQSLYVPVSLLSGITPVTDAAQAWAVQLLWLIGLALVSRLFFRVAVRKITVQGG
jgi:ABC-2 type transport system permease protein